MKRKAEVPPSIYPIAYIVRGSIVEKVVWGITKKHAAKRAQKKIDRTA